MPKIKLQRGLYEGKDLGYSQMFGEHPEWYAKFGMKGHNGIDVPLPTGTKLLSCINGVVTETAYDRTGYGNYIKIENDSCGVIYAHLKTLPTLKVGDAVKATSIIGISGNTGNSTGSHLHFGVFPKPRDRANGYAGYIDPFDKNLVEWVDSIDGGVVTDEVANLRKLLDEMTKNKDEWKERARVAEQKLKELEKEFEDKLNNLNSMRDLLNEMESRLNDTKVLNANLEKDLENTHVELETASETIVKLKAIINGYKSNKPKYTNKELLNLLLENFKNELKKYIKH